MKELWKQNCDQVQEFDLITYEKDRELESLKKESEAKSVTVELPIQFPTELPVGMCGVNVDRFLSITIGLQSAVLLCPVKASISSGLDTTLSRPLLQSIEMSPLINSKMANSIATSCDDKKTGN